MLNGFICLNKEKGMTSSKAVGKLKYILRNGGFEVDKIGHLGTLDPDGEGVLPVALGRGTRLFDYFLDKRKVYYTEFLFGETTDTLDASGAVTETSCVVPTKEQILEVIPSLIGEVEQMPPAYSAKVVNGVRAYKLARKGEAPELKTKKVKIESIELKEQLDSNVFSFVVTCGGGTYIRSIARDMACALGTVGLMRYIKRLESGSFSIEQSYSLVELAEGDISSKIISLDEVCKQFVRYDAPNKYVKNLLNGVKTVILDAPKGAAALYIDGVLTGITDTDGEGNLYIKTRLI